MHPEIPPADRKTSMTEIPETLRVFLQNREELFILFQQAPVPMSCTLLSPERKPLKTFCNPAWRSLFGYAEENLRELFYEKGLFWKDGGTQQNFMRAVLEDGGVCRTEAAFLHADGSSRIAAVSGRLSEVGGQELLISSYHDLTAQRELDAARLQAETELLVFREMVESANDAMLLLEEGCITACNPAALRLYGRTKETLIGQHPGLLSPEMQQDGENSMEKADRIMAEAMAGRSQNFLWQHVKEDGEPFIAEITINPAKTVRLADGSMRKRFVTVLRDITRTHQAGIDLQKSEQRFRQLFERAPVPLCLIEADGRILSLNRRWTQILGYTLEDIPHIENWWEQAYPDPDYRAHVRNLWRMGIRDLKKTGSELKATELKIRCKNDVRRNLMIGGAMVGQDLMISFYDVTEQRMAQKALEELNAGLEIRVAERTRDLEQAIEDLKHTQKELIRSEKLASLGALVAGVAHELNTPIGNAVMVASTLKTLGKEFGMAASQGLKRSALEQFIARLHESSEVIERNLQRAAELIAGFKQVAVDQSSYQWRSFELAEVLHELRLTLSPTLRRSHVDLEEDVSPGLCMDSYPGPLTQVLINVVNNAVLHGFEGRDGGIVRITGRPVGASHVRIEVRDNGRGIDPENLPRIFDPFFTTRMGKGGSGLGLHIVYSLVTELLGGEVQMESQPGLGSTLILTLPLKVPRAMASTTGI